jgi:hypothetical protein
MSSRVLRKLQGDKDLANDLQNDNSDPESDLEKTGGAKKKQLHVNRYNLVRQFTFSFPNV